MGAAAIGLGLCVLMAPELVAGAVVITGIVVVELAIQQALEVYELTHPGSLAQRTPGTEPEGREWPPVVPPESLERERRPECKPIPVAHLGGNDLHNACADLVPHNSFPGSDVFVNGKNFDALQLTTRTLWEVKTDNFNTFTDDLRDIVIRNQLPKLQQERALARACGFDFKVGVRSAAHRIALLAQDRSLDVVVMDWC